MEKLIEQLNKAPNSLKYGGLAAFVAAVTAANFFLLIQDVEDEIVRQNGQMATLERTLAEKQDIAQNLNEKRRVMAQLEQKLQEALTELPEKKDLDELLAQLNDIGKKSGLDIAKVEPGGESPDAFFAKIPVKMVVSGNYHEIAMFLQEVANMRRIVNINNIKLSVNVTASKADKVVLNSEFMATTFRFLDPKSAPTDKKPKAGGATGGSP